MTKHQTPGKRRLGLGTECFSTSRENKQQLRPLTEFSVPLAVQVKGFCYLSANRSIVWQLCNANNQAIIFLKSGGLIYCLQRGLQLHHNDEPQTRAEALSLQKNISSSQTDICIMNKCIYRSFGGESDCCLCL